MSPAGGVGIGIDVVDLSDPRCVGKAGDERFLARVLSPDEIMRVRQSGRDADRVLWALWAAKEAAFKAVTLIEGAAPVFRHRAFVATLDDDLTSGWLAYEQYRLPLSLTFDGDALTALCWRFRETGSTRPTESAGSPPSLLRWQTTTLAGAAQALGVAGLSLEALRRERMSSAERRSVHALPSALARLGLRRDAATWLGTDEARLAVVCPEGRPGRVPPELRRDGAGLAGVIVSLSHHGERLAWALGLRAGSATTR